MNDLNAIHQPVLLEECVGLIAPALRNPGSVVVDCTLGLAGHACAVLAAAPQAHLIGIDRDAEALALATERIRDAGFADRFTPCTRPSTSSAMCSPSAGSPTFRRHSWIWGSPACR